MNTIAELNQKEIMAISGGDGESKTIGNTGTLAKVLDTIYTGTADWVMGHILDHLIGHIMAVGIPVVSSLAFLCVAKRRNVALPTVGSSRQPLPPIDPNKFRTI